MSALIQEKKKQILRGIILPGSMIDLQLSVSSSTGTRHGDGESSPRATVRLFRKRRKNKVRDEWGNCIGECADNCCAKPLLFEKKNNVFLSVSFPSSFIW